MNTKESKLQIQSEIQELLLEIQKYGIRKTELKELTGLAWRTFSNSMSKPIYKLALERILLDIKFNIKIDYKNGIMILPRIPINKKRKDIKL